MSEVRGVKAREAAAGRVSAVEAAPALQGANWPPPGSPAEAYAGRLSPLLSEALAARQLPQLVDALTAGLALIMIEHGSWAAGDVLAQLGGHLCRITNERRAEQEAAEEREKGREVH